MKNSAKGLLSYFITLSELTLICEEALICIIRVSLYLSRAILVSLCTCVAGPLTVSDVQQERACFLIVN